MGNKSNAVNKKLYDNYKVYHPNGKLMFFCSLKKMNWYLNRNLANVVDNNSIKLTFEPGGYGDPDTILQGRSNTCVIDNSSQNLTRHHVIPTQFRKHFELKYKDKNSCDILVLTRKNHDNYELEANRFREQLFSDFVTTDNKEKTKNWFRAKGIYKTLKNHYDDLPTEKQVYFLMLYDGLMDKYKFNESEFKNSIPPYMENDSKLIIKKIGTENLIILWKLHFIKYAKPKFLPDWWKPNQIKIIKNNKINKNICELKIVNLTKNKKLYTLIKKYKLDEIANLYL